MTEQQYLAYKKSRLLTYADLDKLSLNEVVLVSRVAIQSAFAMTQLRYNQTGKQGEKLKKLEALNRHLRELDKERKRPVCGIVMTVEEIKDTFSQDDLKGAGLIKVPTQQKDNKEPVKEEINR